MARKRNYAEHKRTKNVFIIIRNISDKYKLGDDIEEKKPSTTTLKFTVSYLPHKRFYLDFFIETSYVRY